jgi:anti-sigma factor (TIGR02949 family)
VGSGLTRKDRWSLRDVTKLTCQEVLDQLWEYLDEGARAELIARINEHLGDCSHCKVEVDSLRQTISLYQCEEQAGVPIQLSERVRAALMLAYREREKQPE